jgi:hypothetical protein
MRTLFTLYLLLFAGPAPLPMDSGKGCQDEEIMKSILTAVRKDARDDHMDLRAVPMPELDDDLITLQQEPELKPEGKLSIFHVFKVTVALYRVSGGTVSMGTIVCDRDPEWIAVTDSNTNRIFLLEGSTDWTGGFNRLVKTIHFQVTSSKGALDVFDEYLKLARGQEFRHQVFRNDMNLESAALLDFLRFPPAKSRAMFEAWWRAIPAAVMQALEPPVATETSRGFSVEFFFYDWGDIYKETVSVGKDGTIIEGKPQIVLRSGLPE